MKKIILLLGTVFALGTMSCTEDFVNTKSTTTIPLDDFFKTEERLYSSLVAAYDPLKWFDYFYQYDALNMVSDIMSDDICAGGSNEGDQPILVKTHFFTATPTDCCNQIWTIAYSGINRANIVIEHADEVPGLSSQRKNLYVAEATVLKAFYYTLLWKFWGNIPYYEKNLTAPYVAEQLGHDAVYEKIAANLESAIGLDALPMKATGGEEGRLTQAMAYMLYAEVVMYQKDQTRYQQALDYMEDIITKGKYSLVPSDQLANMWELSGEWNSESIYEINYLSDGGVRSWDAPIATGGSVYPVFIGIPGCNTVYADGWGFGPVSKSAYDMYSEGDIRRDIGILSFAKFKEEHPDAKYTPRWQDTGYFLKKYIGRVGGNAGYKGDPNMNYGTNQRYYRYAECLLNAAELSLAVGKDGSGYLKQVRDRARSTDTGYDVDAIIRERHKELVGEGKRYWDLVRTGKAASVLVADSPKGRVGWTENKKYWPIPQSEIDKAGNLTQNPY